MHALLLLSLFVKVVYPVIRVMSKLRFQLSFRAWMYSELFVYLHKSYRIKHKIILPNTVQVL